MRNLRIALAAIAALLLVSFVVQNFHTVTIEYRPFVRRVEAPAWIIIAGSAALGVVAFYFFQAFRKSKKKD